MDAGNAIFIPIEPHGWITGWYSATQKLIDGPHTESYVKELNVKRMSGNPHVQPYKIAKISKDDIPVLASKYVPRANVPTIILRNDWPLESAPTGKFEIAHGSKQRPVFECDDSQQLVFTNGVWRMQISILESGTNEPLDPNLAAGKHWVTLSSRMCNDGFDFLKEKKEEVQRTEYEQSGLHAVLSSVLR